MSTTPAPSSTSTFEVPGDLLSEAIEALGAMGLTRPQQMVSFPQTMIDDWRDLAERLDRCRDDSGAEVLSLPAPRLVPENGGID